MTNKLREEFEKKFSVVVEETDFGKIVKAPPPEMWDFIETALKQQKEEIDRGWVEYFQHKDDMREAGREMAEQYLKERDTLNQK